MRIFIEIEVSAEEIPKAQKLFEALRAFATDGVRTRNSDQLFRQLLSRFTLPVLNANVNQVCADVVSLLAVENNSADVTPAFLSALMEAVLPAVPPVGHSTLPCLLNLLPRLPDGLRAQVRDTVLPHILKQLTQRRQADCSRAEFFQYAEAFAALVQLELVSITGAVITMTSMMVKPENRAAALTMLGKTIELCLPQLKSAKCDANRLAELRQAVRRVPEPIFQYDVNYMEENLGTDLDAAATAVPAAAVSSSAASPLLTTSAAPSLSSAAALASSAATAHMPSPTFAAVAAVAKRRKFVATTTLRGHRGPIFALCFDERRNELLSTGKDSLLMVWNCATPQPQLRQSHPIPRYYACAADLNDVTRSLFLCGVASDASAPPAVLHYSFEAAREIWTARGVLEKPQRVVSCVKALLSASGNSGSTNWFVTGESAKQERSHQLVLYDAAQNTAFERLQPLQAYAEHQDLITAIAQCRLRDGLFFSSSRDCSVRLWDARQSTAAGAFSSPKGTAHDQMVTCLEARDFMLVSGSLDRHVCVWDLRVLGSISSSSSSSAATAVVRAPVQKLQIDETAVLKVALCPELSSYVAVSTLTALSLLQCTPGAASTAERAAALPDLHGGRYHDLRWNAASDTLFAAGDEQRVDVYTLVPPLAPPAATEPVS